jgi:hypothetical protein
VNTTVIMYQKLDAVHCPARRDDSLSYDYGLSETKANHSAVLISRGPVTGRYASPWQLSHSRPIYRQEPHAPSRQSLQAPSAQVRS